MKKSLTESRAIRFYILLCGAFIFGIVIMHFFGQTQSQWRYVTLAGLLISLISFVLAVCANSSIQNEIRAIYPQSHGGEKRFLTAFYYFVRGIFLLTGLVTILSSSFRKDVLLEDLIETSGEIFLVEVSGVDNSHLKIILGNNTNEFQTRTFLIPKNKLEQIKNELHSGDFVTLLIEQGDQAKINNPYIQIYGIKTESKTYFSLDEYNKAILINNFTGRVLGFSFAGPGLIYLLSGKINFQDQISSTRKCTTH